MLYTSLKTVKICTTLYVVCTIQGQRVRKSTGLKIDRLFWINNILSKNHPDYDHYMEVIDRTTRVFLQAIADVKTAGEVTADAVRDRLVKLEQSEMIDLSGYVGTVIKFTMLQDFQKWIDESKGRFKNSTLKNRKYTLAILKEFEEYSGEPLDILTFNKAVFERFVLFMFVKKDLFNNTVAKHAAVLKAFLNKTYPDFKNDFVTYRDYQPEVIALTADELDIVKLTPAFGFKAKTKDLFLFLAHTAMRYSDSQRFHPAWMHDGLIEYSALKTKSRACVPLFPIAKEILERWGGRPPRISSQKFDEYLKLFLKDCGIDRPVVKRALQDRNEIETIHPLYEVAGSHLGRKTFVSVMLEKGVPVQDVMNMTGHQDYRSIKPYISVNKKRMREFARNILI